MDKKVDDVVSGHLETMHVEVHSQSQIPHIPVYHRIMKNESFGFGNVREIGKVPDERVFND